MATSDEPGKSEFSKNVIRVGAQVAGWFLAWLMFKKKEKDTRTPEQQENDEKGCRNGCSYLVLFFICIILWDQITTCHEKKAREEFFKIENTE